MRWLDNAGAQAFCERLAEEHKAGALAQLGGMGPWKDTGDLRAVAAFLVDRDY